MATEGKVTDNLKYLNQCVTDYFERCDNMKDNVTGIVLQVTKISLQFPEARKV